MANSRLYIADTETKEYVCIAKTYGDGWLFCNADVVSEFLSSRILLPENKLITVEEGDEWYNEHFEPENNFNKDGKFDCHNGD